MVDRPPRLCVRRRWTTGRSAAALSACVAALAGVGCGATAAPASEAERVTQQDARGALVVDPVRGSYRGLRLGDSRATVRRRFGPARCSRSSLTIPLGSTVEERGGPGSYGLRGLDSAVLPCTLSYPHFVVEVTPPVGVSLIVTMDTAARTPRGVSVGDEVDDIKAKYPGVRCEDAGEERGAYCVIGREYSSLHGEPRSPRLLYFGLASAGENAGRVGSIWLSATSVRGLAP